MKKIHEEGILLTEAARDNWQEMARRAVITLVRHGVPLKVEEMPEEEFWLRDDGKTLVIKCESKNFKLTMEVPEGQWSWNAQ